MPLVCDKDKDPAALLPASPGLHWQPRPFPGCSSSQNRLERSSERPPRPPIPEPLPAPLYPAEGPWASTARPRAASARRTWPRTRSHPAADTRLSACSCARLLVSAPACLLALAPPRLPRARPASPAASTKGFVCARPQGARTQPLRSGTHSSRVGDGPRSRFWRRFLQKADGFVWIVTQQ